MAQIFPKKLNRVPILIIMLVSIIGIGSIAFIWYYGSPNYTDVGYQPIQPVNFSHKMHAGDLGMDCRYCHSQVEYSPVANVPPTQTCMNCHTLIGLDKKSIDPIRESWESGKPIEWVRVHNLPNYAYFNHSAHVTAGIGCVSCHGNVRQMPIITQKKPLSMGWCLECHRNPDPHLRPVSEMTNMEWEPPADHEKFVAEWKQQKNINPPTDCSGCHR